MEVEEVHDQVLHLEVEEVVEECWLVLLPTSPEYILQLLGVVELVAQLLLVVMVEHQPYLLYLHSVEVVDEVSVQPHDVHDRQVDEDHNVDHYVHLLVEEELPDKELVDDELSMDETVGGDEVVVHVVVGEVVGVLAELELK
ncbi:MAG: hypothetical protein WAW59_08430 [Patescibacteria group bacterium]